MIGLVMAVVAALLSIMMQNLFSAGKGSVPIEMIVTARDIPAGTQLVAEDLTTMPAKGNVKNAISSRSALVGRTLVVPMQKGQMFREEDLIQQGSGAMIASQLPAGYRAITVVLHDTAPGVVLYPGALVDLLATMEMPAAANTPKETITRTVLERIRVLAVNDEAVGIKPNETTASERRVNQRRLSVTLAVTPEQAAQVELASVRGTIGITLRSDADKLTDPNNFAVATTKSLLGVGSAEQATPNAKGTKQSKDAAPPIYSSPLAKQAKQLESKLCRIFSVDLQIEEIDGTLALHGTMPDLATATLIRNFMTSTGIKWVDLSRIAGVQQVQLRVRIAEASRFALRELAFGAVAGGNSFFGGYQAPGGTSPFQPVSISPGGGATTGATGAAGNTTTTGSSVNQANFGFDKNAVSSAVTLFGGVPGSDLEFYIQALSENRYVRLLAEPNLVAISGERATFLVGGAFPIPVVQNSGASSAVTIEYKEFGVRLNFRPEVLGQGRIRLEVAPEVSELSEIGSLRQNGFTIPSVITRRSSTTVELGSGQSFAMAGLLRTKEQGRVSKVPILGDIPVLGVLFRSVRYEEDQTELVVMVTAELVEPLDNGTVRPMPGELHETPNDWELFMEGSLAGATKAGKPLARLKVLGLEGLRGPGALRRPDDPRVSAADVFPATPTANFEMNEPINDAPSPVTTTPATTNASVASTPATPIIETAAP
ncbi:MAG: Flp pilus assembly protein CpaB [Planctomycetota bacterium]|nr:MAG: Flp pilus assembly protein CpaB [Planctomycetota bacterium]